MKQINNLIRTFVLLCILALATAPAYAVHPVPINCVPGSNTAPTGAPIDGGASLLLASGAAYAVRHLRKRKAA